VFAGAPFVIFGIFLFSFGSVGSLGTFMMVFAALAVLLVLAVFGMYLTVLQYSAWILLFHRLTHGGALSKLVRVFQQ
jgi:hypothetical protein